MDLWNSGIQKVTGTSTARKRLENKALGTTFWIKFACCGVILAPLTSTCVLCNIRNLPQINELQIAPFGLQLALEESTRGICRMSEVLPTTSSEFWQPPAIEAAPILVPTVADACPRC